MSLLNDALRKKTSEDKIRETGCLDQSHTSLRHVNGRKISRICGFPLLLGSLVFGVWYFWGSLSAQINSPIEAKSITKGNLLIIVFPQKSKFHHLNTEREAF